MATPEPGDREREELKKDKLSKLPPKTTPDPLKEPPIKQDDQIPHIVNAPEPKEDSVGQRGTGTPSSRRADYLKRKASLLNSYLEHDDKINPDLAYRVGRAQIKTGGMPIDFVGDNLEKIEAEINRADFDAQKFRENSPIVTQWVLSHPYYKGMSREELKDIGFTEEMFFRDKSQWPKPPHLIEQEAKRRAEFRFEQERDPDDDLEEVVGGESLASDDLEGVPPVDESTKELFFQEELEKLKEQEAFVASDEEVGFLENVSRRFDENPIFFLPFASAAPDISRVVDLYYAAKAMESGTADDEQKALLMDYHRISSAMERRGVSALGITASIMTEMPSIIGEFAATGGVYTAVKGATLKTSKEVAENLLKKSIDKLLRNRVSARLVGVGAQTVVASPLRIVKDTIQKMTPASQLNEVDGGFEITVNPGTEKSFTASLTHAYAGAFIELLTERMGAGVSKLLRPLEKGAIPSRKRRIIEFWLGKHPDEDVRGLQKALQVGGIHGVLGEFSEEEVGKLLRSGIGLEDYQLTTGKEALGQIIAFSILPFAGMTAGAIGAKLDSTNPNEFEAIANQVRKLKLREEVPEMVESLIHKFGKENNKEFVYVNVSDFNQHYQTRGQNPRDVVSEVMGDAKTYDEAVEQGTMLKIPVEKYYNQYAAEPESSDFFKDKVKYDPAEQNSDETIELVNQEIERIGRIAEEQGPISDAEQSVSENVFTQLQEAGISKEVSARYSQIYGSMFRVLGERLGQDPKELFDSFNLLITRAAPGDQQGLFQRAGEAFSKIIQGVRKTVSIEDAKKAIPFDGDKDSLFTSQELESQRVSKGRLESIRNQLIDRQELKQEGVSNLGKILFSDDLSQVEIQLFEAADRSTFIHETGHFYLEILKNISQREDAPKEIIDDLDTILRWLDVDTVDQIGTEQHEQFARGFEAYLREGRAPTPSLQTAFRSFKRWLTKIYRSVRGLDVKLSNDVRKVMDRMLATEEEIESASIQLQMEQEVAITETLDEIKDSAKESMMKKLMKDIVREEKKEFKELRRSVQDGIEKEVKEQPVYRVQNALRGGEAMPDGSPLKLSSSSIVENYGGSQRLRKLTGLFSKDGIDPELVANMFGFSSGEAMITAIENSKLESQVVRELTNERMEALRPSFFSSESQVERLALEELHNDAREQHLIEQVKELSKRVNRDAPTKDLLKQRARDIILSKSRSELRPSLYSNAELKATRDSFESFLKNDLESAYQAKIRSLLNHYMFKESSQMRDQFDKTISTYRKNFGKQDKRIAKSRDMNLVNAGRSILATYNIGGRIRPGTDYLKNMATYGDKEQAETLSALVENVTQNPADMRDIPLEQFLSVKTVVDSLWITSLRNNQITLEGKKVSKQDAIDELTTRLDEIKPVDKQKMNRSTKKSDFTNMKFLGFLAGLKRAENLFDTIDGGEVGGAFTKILFDPIRDGINTFRTKRREIFKEFNEIQKTLIGKVSTDKIKAHELNGFVFENGIGDVIGALLHSGNESNLRKLLLGYQGWGSVNEDGTLNRSGFDSFINRMIEEGKLTKDHFDYLQKIWDINEKVKPDTQKAHFDMYGFHFDEITAQSFTNKFGTYRGGYVPAKTDPLKVSKASSQTETEALERNSNTYAFPTTGKGATISRVENYTKPLSLNPGLMAAHLDWALRFTYIEPRVKDVMRVVNDAKFKERLNAFDPTMLKGVILPWLNRAATQQHVKRRDAEDSQFWSGVDAMARVARRNTGLALMMFNVVNTLQQFTGLSIASVRIKPRYVRNAMASYLVNWSEMNDETIKRSEYMRNLTADQSFDAVENIDAIMFDTTKLQKARSWFQKHGLVFQVFTQGIVNTITWNASYNESIEKGLTESQAVKKADADVRLTQGDFSAESISNFEAGTATARMFTMFTSYFNMQSQLIAGEFKKTMNEMGIKKGAARLMYVTLMGLVTPAFVSELIISAMSGDFDEDDDDQYLDDILQMFIYGTLRNATGMVPYIGPVVQTGINQTNDKWYDDRLSLSPALRLIEDSAKTYKSVSRLINEGEGKGKAASDVFKTISLITGIPVSAISRPTKFLLEVDEGLADPDGPIDFTRGLLSGQRGD